MLRRGPRLSDLRPREIHDERPARPAVREKPCSQIYGRNSAAAKQSSGPMRVRDRLLGLMCDLQFHPVHELEEALPGGEWVRAMRDLLSLPFAFDRVADSFRMRRSLPGERKQSLVDLLAGIDMTRVRSFPITSRKIAVHEEAFGESPVGDPGMAFDPTANQEDEPGEGERLILAENPEDLTLSAIDSAVMTAAILAKKSSGKTYLGMVLVEEFISCPGLRVPVVVIDPTGAWYGLLATADGKPSSFRIMILGGPHGVLPITRKQGAQAAEVVHEIWPASAILDLSCMIPSEQHEFVADFGQRLFVLNVRSPLHLIVDEADEFAPQNLDSSSRHQKRSREVLDRIVRRGRIKGFGATLITQRSAVIAKNVISQIDSLFLLNMVAPADLEAVDGWMRYGVQAEQRMECLRKLPNLPPGTAYFMQSGAAPKFRRFVVRRRITFDSSRTPKPNEVFTVPELAKPSEQDVAVAARWLSREEKGKESEELQVSRNEESQSSRNEEELGWDGEEGYGDGGDGGDDEEGSKDGGDEDGS